MTAKMLMVQGTSSHAGKSVLAAALCRIFARRGLRTAPFKSWNMALNSYVTEDGLEIARSQGVQAEAAGVKAVGDMNPFLLKPSGDGKIQYIVRGRVCECIPKDFRQYALPVIEESLTALRQDYDVIVIEGAGSPAEINLRSGDVANMAVAQLFDTPVLLVTDIDRGGALAAVVGTMDLLPAEERRLVVGSVFNRFRGERSILEPGLAVVEEHTKVPVLGVIPYVQDTGIDEEDSVSLERRQETSGTTDRAEALDAFTAIVEANLSLDIIWESMQTNG